MTERGHPTTSSACFIRAGPSGNPKLCWALTNIPYGGMCHTPCFSLSNFYFIHYPKSTPCFSHTPLFLGWQEAPSARDMPLATRAPQRTLSALLSPKDSYERLTVLPMS